MPSIEGSGFPLVFRVPAGIGNPPASPDDQTLAVRTYGRALVGMQKEAIVALSNGTTWRMVSDEGPYLNGTDRAPFPLGFFQAGMQFSLLAEILKHAQDHGISLQTLELTEVNGYSMNGSALQGTMIGGAMPVEAQIKIEADAPAELIATIIRLAEQSSPAHALMRDVLANTFALQFNQAPVPLPDLRPSPIASPPPAELAAIFEQVRPDQKASFLDDIIVKLESAPVLHGVEGGASSSLQAEQKRTLHVQGTARLVQDTLLEATTQVVRPIGSRFRFLCDIGAGDCTPPPLAYLSAGVGFCYMTQLGRYAHITKQNLHSYQIVQDNTYAPRCAFAFDTHTYLEADEPVEVAQKTVVMGERTCFLHASMRGSYPNRITVTFNGEPVPMA